MEDGSARAWAMVCNGPVFNLYVFVSWPNTFHFFLIRIFWLKSWFLISPSCCWDAGMGLLQHWGDGVGLSGCLLAAFCFCYLFPYMKPVLQELSELQGDGARSCGVQSGVQLPSISVIAGLVAPPKNPKALF